MSRYAKNTRVPIDRSQAEIQRTLMKYQASEFAFGQGAGCFHTMFNYRNRAIKIQIPMGECDQENRQKLRCLLLIIKAKLEAVESEIVTVEQEFMPYLLMPDGRTVSEHAMPGIQAAIESGKMPKSIFGETGQRLLHD